MVQGVAKMNGSGNGITSLRYEPRGHKIMLGISMFAMALLGGYLGFLAGDRDPPTTVYQVRVLSPVVERGGLLKIAYTLRRHRHCTTEINRFIYDKDGFRHPLPDQKFNPGLKLGEEEYAIAVEIPITAVAGPARYETNSNYVCNPMQNFWPIIGGQRSLSFTIR